MIARFAEEIFGLILLGGVIVAGFYGIRSLLRHARKFDRDDEAATKP
jgi:hypothetical protein